MNYELGKTIFEHKLWGKGFLKSIEGTVLTIEFANVGSKKLTESSIQTGILKVVNQDNITVGRSDLEEAHENVTLRQYDTSDNIIGGKNILESFNSNDVVVFNESYTVIGNDISAKKISATYDLTVVGDISVEELKVNGNLTVLGNLSANELICANTFFCQGDVNVDKIYVGDIVAKSVKCEDFLCDGNALIQTTIDIDKLCRTEKTMVACEGILGEGRFEALNAVANEYFEFSGEVQGKIIELESDSTLSEITVPTNTVVDLSNLPIKEVINQFAKRLKTECLSCIDMEENVVAEFVKQLSDNSFRNLADYENLFNMLTKISYQNVIDDLGDYLMVVYAKKILPDEIYRYETIEHIDNLMLPKAEENLEELGFKAKSVEHITECMRMAIECADIIPINIDEVFDKIFSSFGIRYSTVKNIINKDKTIELVKEYQKPETIIREVGEKQTAEKYVDMFDIENPKPKKINMSKNKFLNTSVQLEAKYFGITEEEKMRLYSAKIKTCSDFLEMSEQDLMAVFGKKLFLANHLYQAQQKMRAMVEELTEE